VDVLLVSHIDDDHIHSILDLTDELITSKDEHRPALASVLGYWHNTFDDIIGNTPEELRGSITAQFGAAALDGEPPVDTRVSFDAAKVLASVGQGHRLRDDARKLGIPVNSHFGGRLIFGQADADTVDLGHDLKITVVGPVLGALCERASRTRRPHTLRKSIF
jgi:hypothetical protein